MTTFTATTTTASTTTTAQSTAKTTTSDTTRMVDFKPTPNPNSTKFCTIYGVIQ
jgi:hypothetical protein